MELPLTMPRPGHIPGHAVLGSPRHESGAGVLLQPPVTAQPHPGAVYFSLPLSLPSEKWDYLHSRNYSFLPVSSFPTLKQCLGKV